MQKPLENESVHISKELSGLDYHLFISENKTLYSFEGSSFKKLDKYNKNALSTYNKHAIELDNLKKYYSIFEEHPSKLINFNQLVLFINNEMNDFSFEYDHFYFIYILNHYKDQLSDTTIRDMLHPLLENIDTFRFYKCNIHKHVFELMEYVGETQHFLIHDNSLLDLFSDHNKNNILDNEIKSLLERGLRFKDKNNYIKNDHLLSNKLRAAYQTVSILNDDPDDFFESLLKIERENILDIQELYGSLTNQITDSL